VETEWYLCPASRAQSTAAFNLSSLVLPCSVYELWTLSCNAGCSAGSGPRGF